MFRFSDRFLIDCSGDGFVVWVSVVGWKFWLCSGKRCILCRFGMCRKLFFWNLLWLLLNWLVCMVVWLWGMVWMGGWVRRV